MIQHRRLNNTLLFTGNAHPKLAEAISDYLEMPLAKAKVVRFSDGEIFVEIDENVRGRDVFVVQSLCPPVNDHIIELLVMLDALKRASAKSITAVIPYYAYARQDRKAAPRTPITSKLLADIISRAGASRVVSIDLHAGQIQGFFDIPFDHLFAMPVFFNHIRKNYQMDNLALVAPDAGAVERTRAYAKRLGCPLAIIDKRRVEKNRAEALHLIGDVSGKEVIVLDDMIDTAGTITEAYTLLMNNGVKIASAFCTHGLFSGPAAQRLSETGFKEIVTTNSIPLNEGMSSLADQGRVKVLNIGPLLGEAIRRIYTHDSISELFI
jgi:ribose-phosphate pyrophosphokinase